MANEEPTVEVMASNFSAKWVWPPLVMLFAALLLRAASSRISVIDWDESLYLLQAREWLHGGWPLVAAWDMHPVGAPAMVSLALLAFGESVVSARLLGLLAVTATAWILYLTVRLIGGPRAVGFGAGLFYIIHTAVHAGLATNTELLFTPFTCAALAIGVHALRNQTRLNWWNLVVMGLLIGWALAIKQVVVPLGCLSFALPMLPAYLCGALSLRRGIVMGAAYALLCGTPTLAFALAYFLKGDLAAFLDGSFLAPLRYIQHPIPLTAIALQVLQACFSLCWLIVLALVAVVRMGAPHSFHEEQATTTFALMWLFAGCIAVAMPGQYYDHYFLILVPPLSLLAAIGAWRLARMARPSLATGIFACLVIATASDIWLVRFPHLIRLGRLSECCTLGVADTPDVPRLVANRIADELAPGEPIFVFNYQPIVYFLSHAALPTKFIFPVQLVDAPNFTGIDLDAELARVLDSKPHFIIVDRGRMYFVRPSAQEMIGAKLKVDYSLVATFDEEHTDPRSSSGAIELWRQR
jgi:4-amino-4-deoxy-L-arabinose transferase-like glycosyltransferase